MKLIRVARDVQEADKVVSLAKTLPGFKSGNSYRVSGKMHVILSGDFSEEEKEKLLEGHRNLSK